MINIREASKLIEANLPKPATITLKLEEAAGHVLAREITAPIPAPTYTNSAMDGFAVRWQDVSTAREEKPVSLSIIGESRAGIPFSGSLIPGTAVRINTGAMIPQGGDTVIPVEDTADESAERVTILRVEKENQHIRYKGEEFQAGHLLLSSGKILRAEQIALLASMGIAEVPVFSAPRIGVITTGSELVSYDQPAAAHELRDSNGPMLQTLIKECGARAVFNTRVGDQRQETEQAIAAAAEQCDIIIISGGVSVGPHDHVKSAATTNGFQEIFWKVKQKPGKPFFFAKKENVLLFGLPGNPVSAFMGFTHYIKPALRALRGLAFDRPHRTTITTNHYNNKSNRDQLLRIAFISNKKDEFKLLANQGSHMLTSIALADGYIIVPAGVSITAGEAVEVYYFGE